jgi:hypothetical protein
MTETVVTVCGAETLRSGTLGLWASHGADRLLGMEIRA